MSHRDGFAREPDLQPPRDYAVDERDPCDLARDARQREDDERSPLEKQQANIIIALQATLAEKRKRIDRLERNIARFAQAAHLAQEAFTEARRRQEGE